MEQYDRSLSIRDYNLAGGMASLGILPDPRGFEDTFAHEGRRFSCWHFLQQDAAGLYNARELIAGWDRPEEFNRKHPTHPWSYYMMGVRNAAGLRERCTKNAAKFILQRGPSVAIVDPESPRDIQETILGKLGI